MYEHDFKGAADYLRDICSIATLVETLQTPALELSSIVKDEKSARCVAKMQSAVVEICYFLNRIKPVDDI